MLGHMRQWELRGRVCHCILQSIKPYSKNIFFFLFVSSHWFAHAASTGLSRTCCIWYSLVTVLFKPFQSLTPSPCSFSLVFLCEPCLSGCVLLLIVLTCLNQYKKGLWHVFWLGPYTVAFYNKIVRCSRLLLYSLMWQPFFFLAIYTSE